MTRPLTDQRLDEIAARAESIREYADLPDDTDGLAGEDVPALIAEIRRQRTQNTAGLRDRIRRAVCEAEGFAWDTDMLEPDEYGDIADTVLAVLPAPADPAADAEFHRLRSRVAELETYANGCDAEGCVLPHSSWCERAIQTASENDGCTCGLPQSHAMHCWTISPPRNEVEEMRRALASAAPAADRAAEMDHLRDRWASFRERVGIAVDRAIAAEDTIERARQARRRINSALIAVESLLTKPYPDDPRWTPWTRFVGPALKELTDALQTGPDAEKLRRMAAEEQRCPHGCDISHCPCLACEAEQADEEQPATEAETDEQRADREETERDHTAGNHQYCGQCRRRGAAGRGADSMSDRIPLDHLTSDDLDQLYDERDRARRIAVALENDNARLKDQANQARERARIATMAAHNLQRRTPDAAQHTLDRIRTATSWMAVWTELGMYYGLKPEECGAKARSRRLAAERIAEKRAERAEAAIDRVRRLCELTIAASVRVDAVHQALDTIAALDGPVQPHAKPTRGLDQ